MNRVLLEYFRCPESLARLEVNGKLSDEEGFFQFGNGNVCHGRYTNGRSSETMPDVLSDLSGSVNLEHETVGLPFDLSQVIDNLRYERYCSDYQKFSNGMTPGRASRKIYYFLRPILPVHVRRHLQRAHLKGWDQIPFPRWPVDFTVESLMEKIMGLVLKSQKVSQIPFIWFWPNGSPTCTMMTHDVEGPSGRDFCAELMDLDDSFAVKSAFQIVPEVRYQSNESFRDMFRNRGFEINVHDLNHDGALFQERLEFLRRANEINRYSREYRTDGFRSGAMYRKQEWFDAFEFAYDMSVPNVAHLEPQRGGCCTVMPYFIGNILEIPLTTAQDYSLFHILGEYSIDLWKEQIRLISERHGLISFITHPDYLTEKRAQGVYLDLLAHLARLRAEKKTWIALPGEVNRWWRNRNEMKLVPDGENWRIEGPDKFRARIAYASLEGDRVVYSVSKSF